MWQRPEALTDSSCLSHTLLAGQVAGSTAVGRNWANCHTLSTNYWSILSSKGGP